MTKRITLLSASLFSILTIIGGSIAANADSMAPQKQRQEAMKTVGKNMKELGKMAKGEMEFNGKAAHEAFTAMKAAAGNFGQMFPEGSETGDETEASPKIFSDRAGFEKKVMEFNEALDKASASEPGDLDAMKASMGMVGKNCKSCHEAYRVKKDG